MIAILYGFALIGSFSLGYSLLRLIMPQKQDSSIIEKISYGYAFGLLIFFPGMVLSLIVFDRLFFVSSSIVYIILFTIFFVIRKKSGFVDDVELIKEKKSTYIPKKILKATEKENLVKNKFNSKPEQQDIKNGFLNTNKINKQIFKEKKTNIIESLRAKTIEIKGETKEQDKNAALKKLKSFAIQIDKKNNKKKDYEDEINEKELEEIGIDDLDG